MKKNASQTRFLKLLTALLCAALCLGFIPAASAVSGGSYSVVYYDANGGSGWMNSTYLYDETWTVPDSEFTRPGYVFIGWGLYPPGPVVYRPGDVAYTDDCDVDLYAQWRPMNAQDLAALYTPQVQEFYSWDISATVDEETGVFYATADLRWAKLEGVKNFTVALNLGAPDGPRVPALSTRFSTTDGSVTTSYNYSRATIAVPFLADGIQQTVTNGAVNGVLDGDVVYATLSTQPGGGACPGNPVYFTCEKPFYSGSSSDQLSWFETTGCASVDRGDYSATVTLTRNVTLPEGGLTLGSGAYYFDMNSYTLTGTLNNSYGQVFIEQQTNGGVLLAGYANGPMKLAFSGHGYNNGPVGSVSATFTSGYSKFVYDPTLMTASATNGQADTVDPYTLEDFNNMGYANTQEPATLTMADLSDEELAQHIPQNVEVTPTENGLVVAWDADAAAVEADVLVEVVLDNGQTAKLSGSDTTFVAPGNGPMAYAWSTAKGKNTVSIRIKELGANEEQTVSSGYVNGVKRGQKLRIRVKHGLGGKSSGARYQVTPASDPVTFDYTTANIGKTFTKAGTTAKTYLPTKFSIKIKGSGSRVYNGTAQTLDYTVENSSGVKLTKGEDYTEKYTNNTNAGTATLSVIGAGGYTGELTQEFPIAPISLTDSNLTVQLAYTSVTYNGGSQTPGVLVKYNGRVLKEGTDYTVAYANNKNAGTATVTVTGKGNFADQRTEQFTIAPRSMNSDNITATLSQNRFAYTGEAFTPAVTVKWGETAMTEGTDYTLTYQNNVGPGTASAALTGKGNYTDTRNVEFTVFEPVSLALHAQIDPIPAQIYTGSVLTPAVTVRVGDKVLTRDWDYTVSYSNNTAAGMATVTVTGRRDYFDSATASFTIDPADLAGCVMTLSKSEWGVTDPAYTFNGGENKPYATLKFGGRTLVAGTDYTLSYHNNVNAGTAVAIATGKGNFGSTKSAEFTVFPCDLNDISASVATVTYNGLAQTPDLSIYTYYYDANNYQKTYYLTQGVDFTVTGWSNNVSAGPVTGTTYNGGLIVTPTATVTVQGTGNCTGTRTIQFTINPMRPNFNNDFEIAYDKKVLYTGNPVTPNIRIKWKKNGSTLVEGTDYTVTYNDNLGEGDGHNHTDVQSSVAIQLNFQGNFYGEYRDYYFAIVDPGDVFTGTGGTYGGTAWAINSEGTLTVDAGGGALADLSYHNDVAWRPYRNYIKKIVVTNTTTLTAGAFADCPFATEAVLPDGLTTISYGVFAGCDSLTTINIPSTVTALSAGSVGAETFPYTNKLEVHLPDNISTLDRSIPSYTAKFFVTKGSVTEATLRSSGSYFYYEGYPDFMLHDSASDYYGSENGLQLYKYVGSGGIVTVPDFIDYVVGYGLSETYNITKLVIPGSVSKLGTVQYCYNLREIEIQPGSKLTQLPDHFIDGCNNITLDLPDNISSIGTPLNAYSDSNMLIAANCDSYAIEWAMSQMSYGSHVWGEDTERVSGPRYHLLHKNPVNHEGQEPTCTIAGWTAYVTCATCSYDSRKELPALGHSWGEAEYTWNSDQTQVTATRVCLRDDSHVETETVQVTLTFIPATCEEGGQMTYTSAVFNNPSFRVQTRAGAPTAALGHSWGQVEYTWNASHTQLTAARVCTRDNNHVQTETVDATEAVTTPATCTTDGARTYTSKAFENTAFQAKTFVEVIPATGHFLKYADSTAATSGSNGVRGGLVCAFCGQRLGEDRTVSKQKILTVPGMLESIEEEAFYGTGAEQITVSEGVSFIGDRAFGNCASLKLVVLPESVTVIEGNPFDGSDVAVICPADSYAASWCSGNNIPHNP